jgi:hypothetical protein
MRTFSEQQPLPRILKQKKIYCADENIFDCFLVLIELNSLKKDIQSQITDHTCIKYIFLKITESALRIIGTISLPFCLTILKANPDLPLGISEKKNIGVRNQ